MCGATWWLAGPSETNHSAISGVPLGSPGLESVAFCVHFLSGLVGSRPIPSLRLNASVAHFLTDFLALASSEPSSEPVQRASAEGWPVKKEALEYVLRVVTHS